MEHADPAEAILTYARDNGVDQIIMGRADAVAFAPDSWLGVSRGCGAGTLHGHGGAGGASSATEHEAEPQLPAAE